jgi:prolyl-tRNA editing enzyme YbaK/EbsC (Cys-tRNA(Pro) deacylase)
LGSRERVEEYLSKTGVPYELKEFGGSTKNSELAAAALGCTVAEIAKSVVFVGSKTAVVIISGDRRVDPRRLAREIGGDVRVATPVEVRDRTGFPIGGVPPFPHLPQVSVLPDASITRFSHVWAAAGAPNAVFRMTPSDLVRLVGRGPYELAG